MRGDKNKIKIGRQTNVQDRAVIGTIANSATGFPAHVDIGDQVWIRLEFDIVIDCSRFPSFVCICIFIFIFIFCQMLLTR